MNKIVSNIQLFWRSDEGLSALLVCVVVNLFVLSPLFHFPLVRILTQVLFSLILVFGVMTLWARRGARVMAVSFAGASLILHWVRYFVHNPTTGSLGAITVLLFFVLFAYLTLARVFQKGEVTLHRVMGAVAVYLFLGMAWAMLYELVELNWPGAFLLPAESTAGDADLLRANFLYFSFVTLTTVGYGDIVAVLPAARMLAVLEALIGQLFPVVLIARLVSMEIQSRGTR